MNIVIYASIARNIPLEATKARDDAGGDARAAHETKVLGDAARRLLG
jgi:hypothetical protein